MSGTDPALAVLVDFENMARPGIKGRKDFDMRLVLNRLADKGRVLVKRAYADWSRYRDARHDLINGGLELIEMPSAREGAKNRADIKMAVDAMELVYSRVHLDYFVLVSGDSDFTPLVGKLRELNKRVIGVGNRESTSELLVANCDEFIYYDKLAGGGAERPASPTGDDPIALLRGALQALQREGTRLPQASVVKDSMRRKSPAFDESDHGFSTFSKFLEVAAERHIVRLETDPRSGTFRVELADGASRRPAVTADADEDDDEAAGRRRRRRGRGGRGGRGRGEVGPRDDADADAGTLDPDVEVFEMIVTPSIELDPLADLPIDQPISYEDMVMLSPELTAEGGDADLPELIEASDSDDDEQPGRRRRRRSARRADDADDAAPQAVDVDPAPPAGDPILAELALAEVSAEAPSATAETATTELSPTTGPRGRRPRRRRGAGEGEGEGEGEATVVISAEEPTAETSAEPKPPAEAGAEPPVPVEPEAEAPRPARRRRTVKKAEEPVADGVGPETEEPVADGIPEPEAEAIAEPEGEAIPEPEPARPARRRRTTKAAEEPAATEVAVAVPEAEATPEPTDAADPEAKPARKRRTVKKAKEPASDAAPEGAEPAKPARRKRTVTKAAEPSATEPPADAAPEAAPEPAAEAEPAKPARRRRTTKKAEETPA